MRMTLNMFTLVAKLHPPVVHLVVRQMHHDERATRIRQLNKDTEESL